MRAHFQRYGRLFEHERARRRSQFSGRAGIGPPAAAASRLVCSAHTRNLITEACRASPHVAAHRGPLKGYTRVQRTCVRMPCCNVALLRASSGLPSLALFSGPHSCTRARSLNLRPVHTAFHRGSGPLQGHLSHTQRQRVGSPRLSKHKDRELISPTPGAGEETLRNSKARTGVLA